uniref:Uncharacterized protein n=1 Tax=Cacopsylla melanoneura TaxID=428564 RepID=A0A8D8ZDK6_9HEMI
MFQVSHWACNYLTWYSYILNQCCGQWVSYISSARACWLSYLHTTCILVLVPPLDLGFFRNCKILLIYVISVDQLYSLHESYRLNTRTWIIRPVLVQRFIHTIVFESGASWASSPHVL